MNSLDIKNLREDYQKSELLEQDLPYSPIDLFENWFKLAIEEQIKEPNAFVLSTLNINGNPSSRVVLLKSVINHEFVFFTNYLSKKGKEMALNPYVSLNFNWLDLQKQIRIEGKAKLISEIDSDIYFKSRPIESQIGAIISQQSQVIESRTILENNLKLINKENITKPKDWGGYSIEPFLFEFWQGRTSRLHDRIEYVLENGKWNYKRLSP